MISTNAGKLKDDTEQLDEALTTRQEGNAMSPLHKRHFQQSSSSVSQSWFVYLNLALVFVAFAALYFFLPAKRDCAFLTSYNDSKLSSPMVQQDGEIWHKIVVITDLDHDSKDLEKKNRWYSILKKGVLKISPDEQTASVEWKDENDIRLFSELAAGGRSMEFSDLKVFDGRLLSIDDRTGIIYEINEKFDAIPWVVLNNGPGNVTKAFKGEWMTIKNRQLYVGGLGKEWTSTEGEYLNNNPMWIKIVSSNGAVKHVDWSREYKALRSSVGIEYPGYMIHESGQYSEVHKRWFFMPRRASKETYNEAVGSSRSHDDGDAQCSELSWLPNFKKLSGQFSKIADEKRGTNLLLTADDTFSQIDVHHIANVGDGSQGFSAFQFIPNTGDDLIVALKSEEKDGRPVASYLMVFRLSNGHVLLNESKLNGAYKFEGIEFA